MRSGGILSINFAQSAYLYVDYLFSGIAMKHWMIILVALGLAVGNACAQQASTQAEPQSSEQAAQSESQSGVPAPEPVAEAGQAPSCEDKIKHHESGYLGITLGMLTLTELKVRNVKGGVRIDGVTPNSPAEKAQLRANDIILQVDGNDVKTFEEVRDYVVSKAPGDTVEMSINRFKETLTVTCVLGNAKKLAFSVFEEKAPEIAIADTAKWFNSEPLRLNSQKGRVTVLYFWNSEEDNDGSQQLECVKSFYHDYKDKGVTVIGVHSGFEYRQITYDNKKNEKGNAQVVVRLIDPLESLGDYLKDQKVEFPVVYDDKETMTNAYFTFSEPTLYVIDKQGVVRDAFTDSYYNEKVSAAYAICPEKLRAVVDELLAEKVDMVQVGCDAKDAYSRNSWRDSDCEGGDRGR